LGFWREKKVVKLGKSGKIKHIFLETQQMHALDSFCKLIFKVFLPPPRLSRFNPQLSQRDAIPLE